MHFRGATSLADVPFWRKLDIRLTEADYIANELFSQPQSTPDTPPITLYFNKIGASCAQIAQAHGFFTLCVQI
jgi:hypothetical protein